MLRLAAMLLWAGLASAQSFPTRSVRIVVPFPPAGAVDILGRLVGQKVGEKWKQSVLIENRPGGGTVLGTDIVAKSPADGYTLLLAVTSHAINATLVDKLPYDPIRDFAPLTLAATGITILVVHPSVPANSVTELIAYAKANPAKLDYGSPGSGSAMHLSGEMFKSAAGIGAFYVSGEIPRLTKYEMGLPGQVRRSEDGQSWEPDPLLMDERFISVHVKDKGQFVFSACSHAGLINVLNHARSVFPGVPLYGVMGGLHLSGSTEKIIPETIEDLKSFDLKFLAPGHCTGWRALTAMAKVFGDELVPSAVGKRYLI